MIAWVDVETSDLDERTAHLLEVALVVTDDELREVGAFSVVVEPIGGLTALASMPDVVREMHEWSGLLEELRQGRCARRYEAGLALWGFVNEVLAPRCPVNEMPMAGSSVGFDRRWLRHHLPELEARFHYRSIDVSSITEMAKRWAPSIYEERPKAAAAHRALADVRERVEYLRYYRRVGFLGATP